jgi:hypothetical protein
MNSCRVTPNKCNGGFTSSYVVEAPGKMCKSGGSKLAVLLRGTAKLDSVLQEAACRITGHVDEPVD